MASVKIRVRSRPGIALKTLPSGIRTGNLAGMADLVVLTPGDGARLPELSPELHRAIEAGRIV